MRTFKESLSEILHLLNNHCIDKETAMDGLLSLIRTHLVPEYKNQTFDSSAEEFGRIGFNKCCKEILTRLGEEER